MSGEAPAAESSDTVHLTETLPGDTTREWLCSGTPYTATEEQRSEVRTAIDAMNWQRPEGSIAMSPGLLLREVVAQMGLKMVAQIGHSLHPIEHPDCDCLEPYHPDHFATYSLIGIKVRHRHDWLTLYLLDVGVGAAWLISETTPAPMPHNVSGACGLEWHDTCRGSYRRGAGREPCECACQHLHLVAEPTPAGGV